MKIPITRISVAILIGLAILVIGGYYVWHESVTQPMLPGKISAPPSVPVVPPHTEEVVASVQTPPAEKLPLPIERRPKNKHTSIKHPAPTDSLKSAESIAFAEVPAAVIKIEQVHGSEWVDPLLLDAWQAYQSGDFDSAAQHYSDVLRKDSHNRTPPNRDALLGLAAIAQHQSRDAIAAQYYQQVLTLDPSDPDAQAAMSSLPGESASATSESRLKRLIEQHTEAAALHFALGNLFAEQARWGEAQQAYFSACTQESDNTQFVFNLAVSLDHLGQNKLAAAYYQRALQLDQSANSSFDHVQTQARLKALSEHQTGQVKQLSN
jgi:tetratricopeptide (TPR) repeat protein